MRTVEDGGLRPIDAGPLRRASEFEALKFFGITQQRPLGLNVASAWKLIS
jgi:predicted dinucleotide-binding enzyme